MKKVIVGLGELLWDLLPSGARLGGAPANFAYIASLLGGTSSVVSRVGNDEYGNAARRTLREQGLDVQNIQVDAEHPTGSVEVELSSDGAPKYSILTNVAWDHIQWTPELASMAATTDAVCFGTLAQRSPVTRDTIHAFLASTPSTCLRILDVNCRPPFCGPEVVRESLPKANVLKLNSEELGIVLDAASMSAMPEIDAALALQQKFNFKAVCITRGANGSVLAIADSTDVHPGIKTAVADTVGAGDAFVAAVALSLLNGLSLKGTNDAANRIAAWVASQHGAMPQTTEGEQAQLLACVQSPVLHEPI